MGSVTFYPTDGPAVEVVVVGRHRDRALVVLGTGGGDDAWEVACRLLDAYLDADALADPALIVDVATATVRPALRVERR